MGAGGRAGLLLAAHCCGPASVVTALLSAVPDSARRSLHIDAFITIQISICGYRCAGWDRMEPDLLGAVSACMVGDLTGEGRPA